MFEHEIEYLKDFEADTETLKASLYRDEDFQNYVAAVGLKETLYDVSSLALSVIDILTSHGIRETDVNKPGWAHKAFVLYGLTRKRRRQLRLVVEEAYGMEAVEEINARVEAEMAD